MSFTHSSQTSVDAMFDALSDPYRRRVLLAVSDCGRRDEEAFTTAAFASAEMGDDDPDILKTKLFHVHLPKLAESGYVDWDPEAGTIRRGPNFDDVGPLLELLVEHEDELPADFP